MASRESQPELWPENLLDLNGDGGSEARWAIMYTRSRSEKALARQLRPKSIGYYLPLHRSSKRYQRRTVTSALPLFPGYLFIHTNDEGRAACRMFRECVNEVFVGDQALLRQSLVDLRRMLQSGLPVTREERLKPGMLARVTKGPLADLVGRVLKNRGGMKFILELQFVNQGVSVEIDRESIEAV